ncbi:hypothetical protein [Ramlibacter pinisoli]|uniref:hypothetical protein n=1 Tax=Ramlibacter pinisoli TaxID=2682844 RepID=UPI001E2F61AA|nr:hypothetical protein [Ramlibacter pinisoli]
MKLIEHCPSCDTRLRQDRPLAHICDCGFDLRRLPASPASPLEVEVAHLLDGLVPAQLTLPLDLSSGVPPDFDLFLLGLLNHFGFEDVTARPAKAGKTAAPKSVAAARERLGALANITQQWPESFSRTLTALMQAPGPGQSSSDSPRLGTWYRFLFRRFPDPAYNPFRVAAANCIVQVHEGPIDARTRHLQALATVEKEWLSLAEAARELGVRAERLGSGIEDGRIEARSPEGNSAPNRQRFLARTEIDRLRGIRAAYCDESEAAAFLGVPQSVFGYFKEAGLVEISDPATLPPVTQGRVNRSALEALANRLLTSAPQEVSAPSSEVIALRALNLRRTTDRQRLVDLLREIGNGSLPVAGRDASGQVGGMLFDKTEVHKHIASFSVKLQLNVQQISELAGVHYDAVKTWVDSGLLSAVRAPSLQGRPHVIDLQDFVRFLLEFTPLSCLASRMDSSSRGIADELARRGVPLLGEGGKRGTLVRILDLVQVEQS